MRKIVLLVCAGLAANAAIFAQSQLEMAGFRQEGTASFYGAEFEGRPTASGEVFNPNEFTAAHPELPFGTMLIVTNLANNRRVTVRVNDRGPFVHNRVIDVSRAAAAQLDMLTSGLAQVSIEVLPRGMETNVAGAAGGVAAQNPAQVQMAAGQQNIESQPVINEQPVPRQTAPAAAPQQQPRQAPPQAAPQQQPRQATAAQAAPQQQQQPRPATAPQAAPQQQQPRPATAAQAAPQQQQPRPATAPQAAPQAAPQQQPRPATAAQAAPQSAPQQQQPRPATAAQAAPQAAPQQQPPRPATAAQAAPQQQPAAARQAATPQVAAPQQPAAARPATAPQVAAPQQTNTVYSPLTGTAVPASTLNPSNMPPRTLPPGTPANGTPSTPPGNTPSTPPQIRNPAPSYGYPVQDPAVQRPATPPPTPMANPQNLAGGSQPAATNRPATAAPPASSPAQRPVPASTAVTPVPAAPRPPAPQNVANMQQLPAQARVSPIPPQTADSINWPSYPAAEITGAPIVQGHKYRLQVGSFKVAKNAVETFNRLDSAGLNPMYEQYEDYYRVVLTNVSAENIPQTAARLGQAGFSSVMAHEER